ncbi:hypothetical protein WA538_003727 [Blastocystis sp. DL]
MNPKKSSVSQATLVPHHAYLALRLEGFRSVDVSSVPLLYQIISSLLTEFFGSIGSAKYPFAIVAHRQNAVILQVDAATADSFVGVFSFCSQWNGVPTRISCLGIYPTVLSASHRVSSSL